MRGEILVLWLVSGLSLALGAPFNCLECITKRAVFMSRGWGAGGVPFYFIQPKQKDSIDRMLGEVMGRNQPSMEFLKGDEPEDPHEPSLDQRVFPVPNLFVSTGWGPLGK